MHRAFILVVLQLLISCGGRYEVGNHPGDTAGASGAGGASATSSGTTTTGAGGASTTSSGATTTGAGGTATPTFDPCVLQSLRSCRASGCHTPPVSAGLLLDENVLLRAARTALVDRPNHGEPTQADGCPPGAYLLIDSKNPAASLLWLKPIPQGSTATPPCGSKMPVIGTFTPDDKQCLQNWITSVLASP